MAMAQTGIFSVLYIVLLSTLMLHCHGQEKKLHVVYMGDIPKDRDISTSSIHHSMLTNILGSKDLAKESLVYSYGRSFNGFAANLSEEEVTKIKGMMGVVSVFPSRKFQLHTTRSWDFLGLKNSYSRASSFHGGNVIVGMIDTGIWPESESFSDKGFGPPPAKWKGECQTADNFTCNNKIIGARFYKSLPMYLPGEFESPRDSDGHGTHTASTVAGNVVEGASFYGLGEGVARGAVPSARLAIYKVCWEIESCDEASIIAAFDDAIADGVDVISISIGPNQPMDYLSSAIDIGSFHAMRKGILTSTVAGNSGPAPRTVTNISPWSLTVAASSIDRRFLSHLVLGNGKIITGNSINPFYLNGTSLPLIFGGDAANVSVGYNSEYSKNCNHLNSLKVKGKIVFCYGGFGGESEVYLAGGSGVVLTSMQYDQNIGRKTMDDFANSFQLPATVISDEDGAKVLDYIRSTQNPVATIQASEAFKDDLAPTVASFSSRGINVITMDILKPDITAPGIDILAAWSPVASISSALDTRSTNYNIISGTSMACPHASGLAAYIKATHPTWSPAAIKSAIMTTSNVMDPRKHKDAEFAYGSGHINPLKAVHPGLVYDADESDYVDFLCKHGFNTTMLRQVTGDSRACKSTTTTGNSWDLNYPSMSLAVTDGDQVNGIFTRTVTNVGSNISTYYASVSVPKPLKAQVEPAILHFNAIGQKRKFTVKVSGPKLVQQPILSGSITWSDHKHTVRSPLIVYTVIPSLFGPSQGYGTYH